VHGARFYSVLEADMTHQPSPNTVTSTAGIAGFAPIGVATALSELILDRDQPVEQVVARYFTDDYRQRTDGVWSDRTEFIAHIEHLRQVVAGGEIDVHEELRDGARYADRHTVRIVKADGDRVHTEVYLFADIAADGRFRRIEETTMMLDGAEADRGLGSAR
jgi:hypothetical protein